MRMKPLVPIFVFLMVFLLVMQISFSQSTVKIIQKNEDFLGAKKISIENVINDLENQYDVNVFIYMTNENFDEKDFNLTGAYNFNYDYSLKEAGNPYYNIMLFYARVDGKYRLGYFTSQSCKPFLDFVNSLGGEIEQAAIGQELQNIVNRLGTKIRELISEYGADCKVPENKTEEIDVTKGDTVFLTDDNNWQSILSLYPLTTYHYIPEKLESVLTSEEQRMLARKNKIMYNPTLVYHREGEELDLESTLIFLKQFNTKEVVIAHNDIPKKLNLALEEYETREIKVDEYQKLWEKKGYNSVVLSEDNYKTGLMASVFASYTNSPLVFSVSELGNYDNYEKLYCIGNVNHEDCDTEDRYTLEELQKYYHEITNTDKVILVNPNDIEDKYCEHFTYKTKYGKLKNAYCKDSLVSPLLATLKNELMVFVDAEPLKTGVETGSVSKRFGYCPPLADVIKKGLTMEEAIEAKKPEKITFEEEIETKSQMVKTQLMEGVKNVETNYLTIISSPKMIPFSSFYGCGLNDHDSRSSLDLYYSPESRNGWIFGISVSDSSSYVNRDLSFSKSGLSYIPEEGSTRIFEKVGTIAYDFAEKQIYVPELSTQLEGENYDVSCFVDDRSITSDICKKGKAKGSFLGENDIILYDDHGLTDSVVGIYWDDIPELSSAIGIGDSCLTMSYYQSKKDKLFGTNFIRMGGLGYYGAVSTTFYSMMGPELLSQILEGYDLGNTIKTARTSISTRREKYVLLGDPTIKPALLKEVKFEYESDEVGVDNYVCAPDNGEISCARATEKAKVSICGETKEMEVTVGQNTVENPLHYLWDDFSQEEIDAISRFYVYLTSDDLILSQRYDHVNNVYYYECPDYTCDEKYCECYKDQAACKEEYRETARVLLGIPTTPSQPEPQEPAEPEGRKTLNICTGKINMDGNVEGCTCTPCKTIDPGKGTAKIPTDPFKCNGKNFYKLSNNKISPYVPVLTTSRTSSEFLCLTECSAQGECTSSYVEYDPDDSILEKFGGK